MLNHLSKGCLIDLIGELRRDIAALKAELAQATASVERVNANNLTLACDLADAKAALEAYGREKVREGMHLAATIAGQGSAVLPHHPDIIRGYAQGREGARAAILAEMEKEGGE